MKKAARSIIRIAISGAILYFVLKKVNFAEVAGLLKQANVGLLLAALGLYGVMVMLCALRWGKLLKVQGVELSYRRTLAYYFIGFFYNNILPTTVGGAVVRALYAGKEGGKNNEAYSSTLVELIVGGWALVAFALIASLLWFRFLPFYRLVLPVCLAFVLATLVVYLFFHRGFMRNFKIIIDRIRIFGIGDKIKEFYKAIYIYRDKKALMVEAVLLSLVIQLIMTFTNMLIGVSLGFKLPFMSYMIYPVIIGLITTIPITLNGLGLREWGYGYFFTQVGLTGSQAVTLSLLFYLVGLIGSLAGAVVLPFVKFPEAVKESPLSTVDSP
jgi:uncharacterized protein (TIRG00374 family)